MKCDRSVLIEGCKKTGITLIERQTEQFLTYYEFLVEKNKVMNLTAITEYEDVVLKHFIDSLSLAQVLNLTEYHSLIDVGTGAGFPSVPLKIVFPHLRLVLLDSLNKRIRFLDELTEKLGIDHVETLHARAEDAAKNKEYREQFDLCVSRAVANLSSLSEYCIPFVKKGGWFVSYKSTDIDMEVKKAERAFSLLGGACREVKEFYLPGSEIGRSFVMIEKIKETPLRYPRKAGLPSKEPL